MRRVILKGRGQITIPAKIRKALGLGVGDLLEVEINGGKIILTPLQVTQRPGPEEGRSPQEARGG